MPVGRGGHTAVPELKAISLRFLNTNGTVKGFGLKRVFWLFFEFYGSMVLVYCLVVGNRGIYLSYQTQISLLLQVSFNGCNTSSCRFRNGFDEKTFPDTQLDADVVRTQLPMRQTLTEAEMRMRKDVLG